MPTSLQAPQGLHRVPRRLTKRIASARLQSSKRNIFQVPMQRLKGLHEVADRYQGLLLDQFGVLHDGQQPYPAAIEAVEQLHAAGKKLFIISNSSRRSGGTIKKLAKMGFKEDWFDGAITSGEMTHRYLTSRPNPWWQQLGRKCLHITWSSRGSISLEGLGLEVVTQPEQADFILAHGTEALGQPNGEAVDQSLEQLQELLSECARLGSKPMVVANPDLVTVDGEGLIVMPGTLAKSYKDQGGEVQLMGKPDPRIYEAAMEMLLGAGSKADWLAVGDSLEHDIAGASAAGIASVFIVSGIHAKDCGYQSSEKSGSDAAWDWDGEKLACLMEQHACTQPEYVLSRMMW